MRIIRGKYGKRRFSVPTNIKARPTTDFAKENIFNVLSNYVDFEDKTALDLFSGTGAIAAEFASLGCKRVVAVESYHVQLRFIKSVVEALKCDEITVIKGDVFKYVPACCEKFDFVFADPPYDLANFETVPKMIIEANIINPDGIFIIEHSRNFNFSNLPNFFDHRVYGSVNFSIFKF